MRRLYRKVWQREQVVTAAVILTTASVASGVAAGARAQTDTARPSGTIAYSGTLGPDGHILVTRPDGSRKRLLVDHALAPAWSRDGRLIAFVTNRGRVGIAQRDGTKRRELLIGPGGFCNEPTWSPSGREIACAANWIQETRSGPVWHRGIYVGNLHSGRSRKVAEEGLSPAWSPDGSEIAFQDGGIAVLDVATNRITRLGSGSSPDWSPDGARIAYSTNYTVAVMKRDGSGRHTIAKSSNPVGAPSWAPDGSRLVFDSTAHGGLSTLFIVRADGSGGPRVLTHGGAEPDWGP